MIIHNQPFEEYKKGIAGIQWVNPSSFKGIKINTPHAYKYFLDKPEAKESDFLNIGHMVHEFFLERKQFERNQYIFLTTKDFGFDFKATKEGFPNMSNAANKQVVNQKELMYPTGKIVLPEITFQFNSIRDSFYRIKDLEYLLDFKNGASELSFYVFAEFENYKFVRFVNISIESYLAMSEEEKRKYLPIRTRMDYCSIRKRYILDIKTTKSLEPSKFKREIEEYGYHIQAALELDVASCEFESTYDTFIFICAENDEPFDSIKYIPVDRMIEAGRNEYKRKLEFIYKARLDNYYPGLEMYSELVSYDEAGNIIDNRQTIGIDLPDWYYKRNN